MNANFPRVLTLLRKEKNISQKKAAEELGISQALLSHYEKGIRECGLDFLVRSAKFYGVSTDYLLGVSPDRSGTQLTVEDIPEPDSLGKENTTRGSILTVLNKKLIANSLNILFDLLSKSGSKALITEVSNFLMLSVYRMFRVVYSANPKNQSGMFTVPKQAVSAYANAAMGISEAHALAAALKTPLGTAPAADDLNVEEMAITSEKLSGTYPLFYTSLINLVQNSEEKIKVLTPEQNKAKS